MNHLKKFHNYYLNEKIDTMRVDSIEKGDSIIEYYANGVLVATKTKAMHHYHSMQKDGRMSTLRDKEKIGYECRWIEKGLKQIFGNVKMNIDVDSIDDKLFRGKKTPDFIEDKPDHRTGYNGNLFSKKFIKDSLINFQKKHSL